MRFKHVVAVFGALMLAGSMVSAQAPAGQAPAGGRGTPPPEPKNLKVLPTSTTTAQILPIMRTFTAALGTNCGYCHEWTGAGLPTNDYAVDTKPPKLVARVMMQLVGEINTKLAANIKKPADQMTAVGCMTCHRGEAIPKLPPPAAPAAPPAAK